jgi:hypothetical protein
MPKTYEEKKKKYKGDHTPPAGYGNLSIQMLAGYTAM